MSWNRATPITPTTPAGAKVIILIPHRDEHDYRQWSQWWLTKMQKPPGTLWLESRGLSLTTNRTKLIREALKSDATHFFFLDDDVIAPDDVIPTLLAANLPIVCGLYMAKKAKGERGLSAWMKVSEKGYAAIGLEQTGRYVQVDVTALGCVLLHRSIFERVPEPWFVWDPDSISEDFFFFEKVADTLNIKPVADMECRCLHIGIFALDTNNEFDTLGV
ncbi:hypothetical protein ES703_110779 [subsurface metagenome]